MLLQSKPSTTFSAYTYAELGAEAFTLELGKARPFGHNELVNLDRLELRLQALIEGNEPPIEECAVEHLKLFAFSRELIKHSDAFVLHLPADVENFTELEPGYLLAEDLANSRWVVEEQGARIIFPNPKVHNGQRAGILIVPAPWLAVTVGCLGVIAAVMLFAFGVVVDVLRHTRTQAP